MGYIKKILSVLAIMAAVSLSIPVTAVESFREADRDLTWDFIFPITYSAETSIGSEGGSNVKINDDIGFGFGVGYHFNNHFELGGYFNWNSSSYDATVVKEDGEILRYGNTMEASTIAVNGTYFLLNKSFTPFISADLGYTFIDTNIQDGPPQDYCWWDPWWGYICDYYVPTKTLDSWSYGGGIGLRYDFNRSFSMQASYNKNWYDMNAAGTNDFDIWKLEFIYRMF